MRARYQEYGIESEPFVIVKADAGTYGMGVMTVKDAAELIGLNRKPVSYTHLGQYSHHFLATIDWCLQLDPLKRPQSCFALQKVLAQRHREAPPPQKTWLEGLGSRLKTMIGRT